MNTNTASMVPIPLSQTSHRKNRRRERPGARKRHALALAHEVAEGMSMASDYSLELPLPHHHSHALSRQHLTYDRNWKAWKAREEECRAAAMEKEKNSVRQSEKDAYINLFGGEADDDVSLCQNMLGVVYSLWGGIDYIDP